MPASGLATTLASVLDVRRHGAVVVLLERRFRRYRLFGRFWRADWPRFAALLRLGLPIGGILAFEVTIFNAAALLMGLIDAASLAAHAIAIQIASISFMVPLGLGQAVTVRVGLAFGARDPDGISRAGWTAYAMGVGFMALMALVMIAVPDLLIGAFIDIERSGQRRGGRRSRWASSPSPALFQIVDGAQAVGARHAARPARHHGADDLCGDRLLGRRPAARRGARLPFGLEGNGIWIGLSSASPSWRCCCLCALAAPRAARADRRATRFRLSPAATRLEDPAATMCELSLLSPPIQFLHI